MKIVLSVQPIQFPLTGIGRYTFELARHLADRADIETLRYFSNDAFLQALPSPGPAEPSPALSLLTRLKRRLARNPILLEIYRKRAQARRARVLAPYSDHLYHGPNFYLPPFAGKSVVTIHDLSVFTMPDHHPTERVMYMNREVKSAVAQATMLIAVSEFTRREVAEYFNLPLDRISVTPLASGPEFHPRGAAETAPLLGRHALQPQGYALYVGTIEPRKNIGRLIDAYGRLPAGLRARYPLVLAGYKGWHNDAIMAKIDRAERQGWLRYLGFVANEDLPVLFAGARLFAFPSLYEGFGLPVLEAMASGVPVLISEGSSLPEVAGEAAARCGAEDVETMTALLQQGLEDETWRAEAVRRGLRRAQDFSWRRCADETAAIYRAALAL